MMVLLSEDTKEIFNTDLCSAGQGVSVTNYSGQFKCLFGGK